jgi:hypothetical protein
LAIVLAIFLWFMDSDYPFGIFKLFLHTYTMYPISCKVNENYSPLYLIKHSSQTRHDGTIKQNMLKDNFRYHIGLHQYQNRKNQEPYIDNVIK